MVGYEVYERLICKSIRETNKGENADPIVTGFFNIDCVTALKSSYTTNLPD
jgi:hypothetical protein